MAATVRSTGAGNSSTNAVTSFSPPMPAGFVAGDLLIGIACNGGGDVPATRPSGITTLNNIDDGTTFNMDVVRKIAVGGEVWTWTTTTARRWAGCVIAITAGTFDAATPITGNAPSIQGSTSDTLYTTATSTPANADSLIIAAFGSGVTVTWSTTNTAPTMTEICDTASSGTAPTSLAVFRSNTPPAIGAMTRSAVQTTGSPNGGDFICFINPGSGGGGGTILRRPRARPPQFRR
ncbi:MAG TPA: hypothetical protein VES42_16265 [Pilimelia sp.]|nr:hypothetical protein [Pilimelia sp.]